MLSRVEICAKYGLQPLTFEVIEEHLSGGPVRKHGRAVYKLTAKDDFVLQCARLHAASFALACKNAVRLYPFHRFLLLRFLTSTSDEIMAEIEQRRLAPRLGADTVKYMEKIALSMLPPAMKKLARKKQEPSPAERGNYKLMLRVLGIDSVYDNPEWLDRYYDFIGDPDHKVLFEVVMTTRGDVSDWQEAYETLTQTIWEATPLDLYASIFYDVGYLTDLDWKHYLSLLPPSERDAKRRAKLMTTPHLCVLESNAADFHKTMRVAAAALQKKILLAIEMRTDGLKTLQGLLVSFNNCGKATGEMSESPKMGFFQNIRVEPSPMVLTTVEDISPAKKVATQ